MEFDSELLRGVVEPVVLRLLAERRMCGYEIINVVNERTKGTLAWKEGTLYPCLHRMEVPPVTFPPRPLPRCLSSSGRSRILRSFSIDDLIRTPYCGRNWW